MWKGCAPVTNLLGKGQLSKALFSQNTGLFGNSVCSWMSNQLSDGTVAYFADFWPTIPQIWSLQQTTARFLAKRFIAAEWLLSKIWKSPQVPSGFSAQLGRACGHVKFLRIFCATRCDSAPCLAHRWPQWSASSATWTTLFCDLRSSSQLFKHIHSGIIRFQHVSQTCPLSPQSN